MKNSYIGLQELLGAPWRVKGPRQRKEAIVNCRSEWLSEPRLNGPWMCTREAVFLGLWCMSKAVVGFFSSSRPPDGPSYSGIWFLLPLLLYSFSGRLSHHCATGLGSEMFTFAILIFSYFSIFVYKQWDVLEIESQNVFVLYIYLICSL